MRFVNVMAVSVLQASCAMLLPKAPAPAAPREDPAFSQTRDDLAAVAAKETDGYTKIATIKGQLDSVEPAWFEVKPSHCYVGVMRLAPDAAFSARARQGVRVGSDSTAKVFGLPGAYSDVIHGPGAVVGLGCAETEGKTGFALFLGEPRPGENERQIGTGAFTFEAYAYQVPPEVIARYKDERRQERRAMEAEMRQHQQQVLAEQQAEKASTVWVQVDSRCREQNKWIYWTHDPAENPRPCPMGRMKLQVGDEIFIKRHGMRKTASIVVTPNTRRVILNESCSGFTME